MTGIPRAPLLLGLAGVLPFTWGALTVLVPALGDLSLDLLGPRFTGRTLLLLYGTVILGFMSGVIWGFATRATGRHAAVLYALSTLPALWAVFSGFSTLALALGFAALLLLDRHAQAAGLAPPWWLRLRLLLTALVVLCLLPGLP
ncbi:DUF3429 domain-containing protein [Rubellimicrobium aerolatum]|uniref:DUF3429 domain-containing protein n=1 Tax=Rubellimicrobium aerolatum TaxID=490979 RepID=A0ABW0SD05_9RHOB|nr:DUF3429 domain-containing protein [Rubellimicrobium aerolatum]MBP1806717.1 hypothetical protein [Rubellimicrobium aerolatum]